MPYWQILILKMEKQHTEKDLTDLQKPDSEL
jgi:hypothetical protein